MDQNLLLDAITKHLDALEANVNAIILLAIAAAWNGLRRTRELEALGMKFDRRHAFWILGSAYVVANVAAMISFLRLGDLLSLIENTKFEEAFTRLAVHPWVLNPLSHFGGIEVSARVHASGGWGLLILTWWLCTTSLATLMDSKRGALVLFFALFAVGLGSIIAIYSAQQTVFARLGPVAPHLLSELEVGRPWRIAGTWIGVASGLLIFFGANHLREKTLRKNAG